MKEIDFLPEWYRSNRLRQLSCRAGYLAIGCMFIFLVVWNSILAMTVSKAKEDLNAMAEEKVIAEIVSNEFAEIRGDIAELDEKDAMVKKIDSKIDVAAVFAELSFLVDRRVLLSKVEFKAEGFSNAKSRTGKTNGKNALLVGDVRFKIAIDGIAADAGEVADLVCRLESSPYFCMVYPAFSKNKNIKTHNSSPQESGRVSEFEINCYLANFQLQTPGFAKHTQVTK